MAAKSAKAVSAQRSSAIQQAPFRVLVSDRLTFRHGRQAHLDLLLDVQLVQDVCPARLIGQSVDHLFGGFSFTVGIWERSVGGRCCALPVFALNLKERLGGGENGYSLITTDREQIVIAGDDEIGLGGEGSGDDLIVIGIPKHHARRGRRLNDFDYGLVIRQHLRGGFTDQS